jgi:cyclopropane-fatty-acyl-phospholipid synthase
METMMLTAYARHKLESVGVEVNGRRPHDIQIHDPAVLRRAAIGGFEKLGEDYQLGKWHAGDIPELVRRLRGIRPPGIVRIKRTLRSLSDRLINLQSEGRAARNVHEHYDFGNDLYEAMLDISMQYSCAYFGRGAKTLQGAQEDKMRLIAEKLRLKPGMRVLDIGCGWGGLAAFLAKEYRVTVIGITLSREQLAKARECYAALIADGAVEYRYLDYRHTAKELGQFDRIVSVGMLEHVGERNLETFFHVVYDALKPGGVALIHNIIGSGERPAWIGTYIFPGGLLPRIEFELSKAREFFDVWDEHRFGKDYAKTLQFWKQNFLKAWPRLQAGGKVPHHPLSPFKAGTREDQEYFFRTWLLYLDVCTGAFIEGGIDLCQLVLGKGPRPPVYNIVR